MNRLFLALALGIWLVGGIPMAAREVVEGPSISNPVWGVTLEVPGFEVWEDHPLRGRPDLVLAGTSRRGECELNVSLFAIPIATETTAAECREGYAGNPDPLRGRSDVTLHAAELTPITYTLFDQQLGDQGTQSQLYGYWTRPETCFELHVSSTSCRAFAERALPILRSVRITDDPDVTLETVAVAQATGGDPHDWAIHFQLASTFLHGVDPPKTDRARRFYQSARRLAGGALQPMEEWTIEEGIGLSWLEEDAGDQAIPSLERAVEIARDHQGLGGGLEESLYNLACAHSLAGNPAVACEHLSIVLSGQDRSQRTQTLSDIREDPQLEAVRKETCFDSLAALMKQR